MARQRLRDRSIASDLGRTALIAAILIVAMSVVAACGGASESPDVGSASSGSPVGEASSAPPSSATSEARALVTFVELGSDSCVPCREMRPVMDAVARTFGDQIEIVFHDVAEDAAAAQEYGIQYIPTQVFLDETGTEFHRHVGFYPQEEIEAMLLEHGLEKRVAP